MREPEPPEPVQLPLDLPFRPATDRADFLVAPSNRAAVGMIDRWPDWPGPSAALSGPPGSGKSHLAAVFTTRTGAMLLSATALEALFAQQSSAEAFDPLALFQDSPALVVEDIDPVAVPERALFHLLNAAAEAKGFLLLTSVAPPLSWTVSLRDLDSRLTQVPAEHLAEPDDLLLAAVLMKLFGDRGIEIAPRSLSYAVTHMTRSFASAQSLVEQADARALTTGKGRVTQSVVRAVIEGS
ncbi:MAG: DnaA regulatory inactivator Hda [Rhodospirillaceae bacterium]